MVATNACEEDHVTDVVKFCVLKSEKVPVAENGTTKVVPRGTLTDAGVTLMDTSSAGVTVSEALFEVTPERLAVMVVVPSAWDLASPFEPVTLLIIATAVSEEFQVTDDVMLSWVPSEKVPVAINCRGSPRATLWLDGVTSMDSSTAWVTVKVDDAEGNASTVAVMVAVPRLTAVASPFEPAVSLTVATPVVDVAHVASDVTSCMLQPPDNVPMAENCWVIPLGMDVMVGDVTIDATAAEESVAELATVS